MNESEILEKLNSIGEDVMTKDIIVPMYKKAFYNKYFDIEFTGGRKTSEQGCDITYYEITPDTKSKEYCGVQVKQGNINSSKDQNTGISSIAIQAQQAFTKDVVNVSDKKKYKIKAFIILTTGEILPDARSYIVDNFSDKIIRFLDGHKIAKMISDFYLKEFIAYFKIDTTKTLNKVASSPFNVIVDYLEEEFSDNVDNLQKSFRPIGPKSTSAGIIKYLIENGSAKEFQIARELDTNIDYIKDSIRELVDQDIVEGDEDGIKLTTSYYDDYPFLKDEAQKRINKLGYETDVSIEEVMNRIIRG